MKRLLPDGLGAVHSIHRQCMLLGWPGMQRMAWNVLLRGRVGYPRLTSPTGPLEQGGTTHSQVTTRLRHRRVP